MIGLWRQRPYLTSAFALSCLVTLFFLSNIVWHMVFWSDQRHQEIQPWMTVGYIGRAADVDPREIDRITGLPQPEVKGHPQPLSEIARDRGVPVEDLIAEVQKAVRQLHHQKAGP